MQRHTSLSRDARLHVAEARLFYARFAREMDSHDPDAAVIMLFLSALHLVQAHAVRASKRPGAPAPPTVHTDGAEYAQQHLGTIAVGYRRLQFASEGARYELVRHSVEQAREPEDGFLRIRENLRGRDAAWDD